MRGLRKALGSVTLGELLGVDLLVGLVGLGGGIWIGLEHPDRLNDLSGTLASVVGVVVGAVVAGIAVQTAFLDQSFLRKLQAIGRDPVRYLVPFIFTATLGVFAMLSLIVVGALIRETSAEWLAAGLGGAAGLFAFWTVASLLPGMATLIQFVGLRTDALDVPDDATVAPIRRTGV